MGRRIVGLMIAAGLVGAMSLVVCGPAAATVGHRFAGSFGGVGQGDGLFNPRPVGVGVLDASGDVFVGDPRQTDTSPAPRIQRFDGSGVFVSSFEIGSASYFSLGAVAVDSSGSGAVYAFAQLGADGQEAEVAKFGVDGTLEYVLDRSGLEATFNFFANAALAVDPVDGSVYVAATSTAPGTEGAQVVARFDGSTGAFIDSFNGLSGSPDGSGFACPSGLTVDAAHRVYVLDPCKGRVDRYVGDTFDVTITDSNRAAPSGLARDPASGELYVTEAGPLGLQVTQFAADGTPVYTFDASVVDGMSAIAVSGTGMVYIVDSVKAVIHRFEPFDGPTVVTGDASSVERRSATVAGTLDPEGAQSSYHFEYGTGLSYGSRTEESDLVGGSGALPASAELEDLKPNTTYNYRIVGSSEEGSIIGANRTFTTLTAPPTVEGPAFASAIGPRSARLHATANANSTLLAIITRYTFEYGTTTAYGQSAIGALCGFVPPCGPDDIMVAQPLSGLSPGTTYHFRLVADNGHPDGPQAGVDHTFTTAPAAAADAAAVTTRRATLTGTIDPGGVSTTYHFNYGPTSAYGASTPEVDGGSGDDERIVTEQISGLSPSTTYHVQVVAISGGETRFGADGLFRTPAAPTATAISPTGVTTNAATLVGDVDTHGLTGSYHFEVSSLDSSYTTSTAELALPGNETVERVTSPVSGLPDGETFVVRLSVTSNDFTQVSDQVTFGTPPLPRVFPLPPSNGPGVYGCGAPRLDAYSGRPKPGDAITITGADLGVGGSVVFGERTVVPTGWSATGFRVEVPEDARGVLGLTVNCGRRSNTISVAAFAEPVNRFSITKVTAKGSTARLSVKVPGPGKVETSGSNTRAAKTTIARAGTATVSVRLSNAGVRALARARSHRLRVRVGVRFTPAGGRSAARTVAVTYRTKAGR